VCFYLDLEEIRKKQKQILDLEEIKNKKYLDLVKIKKFETLTEPDNIDLLGIYYYLILDMRIFKINYL